SANPAKAYRKA
ncbi:siderophore-mediated iron transport protein, partial [Helicobacter pylori]